MPETLTFGVVPQHDATRLAELWLPVTEGLGARSGLTIRFRTDPDIPTFTQRLAQGAYDIAYMNPEQYSTLRKSGTYLGLVADTGQPLVGVLVVRRAGDLGSLADLTRREVCFPAPQAFAATRLTRQALKDAGVDIKVRYVGSHDSVYRLVASGQCAAGGGVTRTLALAPDDVRQELKVLWRSPSYPNHVLAVRAGTPAAIRERLVRALLAMSKEPGLRARLGEAGLQDLAPVDDRNYLTLTPERRR